MKLGNYAVIANDHTLVLGWNSAAVPLLRQMAMTKAQYPKPNALQRCAMATRWAHAPPVLLWADVSRNQTLADNFNHTSMSVGLWTFLRYHRATIVQRHC